MKQFLTMFLILMYAPSALACQTADVPFAPGNSTVTPDGNVSILDFSSNVTTGEAPLHVDFSCSISNSTPITNYQWVFGPVSNDYFSNHNCTALHTFTTPGLYNITLTVVEANGQKASMTKIGYINVTSKVVTPCPVAPATSGDNTKLLVKKCGRTVTFTETKLVNGKYMFSFGDGKSVTSTCNVVKHTYAKCGTYIVICRSTSKYIGKIDKIVITV